MKRPSKKTYARAKARLAQRAELSEARARLGRAKLANRQITNLAGSFENATRGRLRSSSAPRGGSAQAHRDTRTRQKLREDCQALRRNNPLAKSAVARLGDLVVGDTVGFESQSEDPDFNERVDVWFAERFASREIDHAGILDGAGILRSVLAETMSAGRHLLLKTRGGRVQLIEDERLRNPQGKINDEFFTDGLERRSDGRPIRYHIADWRRDGSGVEFNPTARLVGDCIVARNALADEPNLEAPEPALSAATDWLDELDATIKATHAAQRLAAMFGVIFDSPDPTIIAEQMPTSVLTAQTGDTTFTQFESKFERGMMLLAPEGTNAKQIRAEHPNTSTVEFIWMLGHIVGAMLGLPLELWLFKFDQSYTAHRASLSVAWRGFGRHRALMRFVAAELRNHAVAAALRAEQIPGITRVPASWNRVGVKLARIPVLDPKVETEVAVSQYLNHLTTRADACERLQTGDSDRILEINAADLDRQRELGATRVLESGATPEASVENVGGGAEPESVKGEAQGTRH